MALVKYIAIKLIDEYKIKIKFTICFHHFLKFPVFVHTDLYIDSQIYSTLKWKEEMSERADVFC